MLDLINGFGTQLRELREHTASRVEDLAGIARGRMQAQTHDITSIVASQVSEMRGALLDRDEHMLDFMYGLGTQLQDVVVSRFGEEAVLSQAASICDVRMQNRTRYYESRLARELLARRTDERIQDKAQSEEQLHEALRSEEPGARIDGASEHSGNDSASGAAERDSAREHVGSDGGAPPCGSSGRMSSSSSCDSSSELERAVARMSEQIRTATIEAVSSAFRTYPPPFHAIARAASRRREARAKESSEDEGLSAIG